MRYFPVIILLFLSLIVLSDCSQNGCPGGMCPPDHYYASRRTQRKTMNFSYKYNKVHLISFRRAGTGWSRRLNQNKVSLRIHNTEDPGASLSLSKGGSYNSNINSLVYDASSVKNRQSRYLNKTKINAGRGGHQEGLWSPQMQNWQSKVRNNRKKARKQKVRTVKLR